MKSVEHLTYLVEEIHSAVVATVDDEGLPVTAAIDMMLTDEGGLYFLTAKGKSFYRRLTARPFVALSAMKGTDTLSTVVVSVRGAVKNIGRERLEEIFEKNPYMAKIYPTEKSREALEVFQIYRGEGAYFDLTQLPPRRREFSFGGGTVHPTGYRIDSGRCTGCRACEEVCPQGCIDFDGGKAAIRQENCLHCGNCMNVCPQGAVIREG